MKMKRKPKWTLGINISHNGSICLLKDDQIHVAIQEERLNRQKRSRIFLTPDTLALNYCLEFAGIGLKDISSAAICTQAPRYKKMNGIKTDPNLKQIIKSIPTHFMSHHLAHATSTFAVSGFKDSAILVADGVGSPFSDLNTKEKKMAGYIRKSSSRRYETISLYSAQGTEIQILKKEMTTPISNNTDFYTYTPGLGLMYRTVAAQVFADFNEAGKVMGLAPYGKPTIPIQNFYKIQKNQFYFTNQFLKPFIGLDPWPQNAENYQNLAASVQQALEHALMHIVSELHKLTQSDNFCYAGGVALNSVANEKIIREGPFKNHFILPASEDSGIAIGAAYHALWKSTHTNTYYRLQSDSLGASYSQTQIKQAIQKTPAICYHKSDNVIQETSKLLTEGKFVGWFDGRSELGPRALGHRSILCDPRLKNGKEHLNARVKGREAFRPFAPVILEDHVNDWFDVKTQDRSSPFMLRVMPFRKDKRYLVPSVVHVDGTGRIQTVNQKDSPKLYQLIHSFYQKTGIPILLNTSFNVMGEPIVETPSDALWCLLATGLDFCVLDDHIVSKHPKYKGILDLTPYLLSKPKLSKGVYHFKVQTPWGPLNRNLKFPDDLLVPFIDGKKKGHQLVQETCTRMTMKRPIAEKYVKQCLTIYKRFSIIDFENNL